MRMGHWPMTFRLVNGNVCTKCDQQVASIQGLLLPDTKTHFFITKKEREKTETDKSIMTIK